MLEELIAERAKTHGDFTETAEIAQRLRSDMGIAASRWDKLSYVQREALDCIAAKIARILTGDSRHRDAWIDIQGYCQLVLDRITDASYNS